MKHRNAQIDEMLAPLIKTLWTYGIETVNCCQENKPGISWIEFMTVGDGMDFLNVIANVPTKRDLKTYKFWDTMYGRMTRMGGFGEWEYSTLIRNIDEDRGGVAILFSLSVRFPQWDLPAIMKAFSDEDRVYERLERWR